MRIATSILARVGGKARAAASLFGIAFAAILAAGLIYVLTIDPQYSATTLIGPQSSPQEAATQNNLSGSLGGIVSLFGTKERSDNFSSFQALLGTASFAQYLIAHDKIDQLIFPEGVHHSLISRSLHGLFGRSLTERVTPADVQEYLQTQLYIQPKVETPYVEIRYTNKNRETAIRLLNILLVSGDRVMRQREAAQLDGQISYLGRAIRDTTDVESQALFRKILLDKLSANVLINTQSTYAFRIFDAPYAPQNPNSPNVAVLLLGVIVFALLMATIVTVGWLWWTDGEA